MSEGVDLDALSRVSARNPVAAVAFACGLHLAVGFFAVLDGGSSRDMLMASLIAAGFSAYAFSRIGPARAIVYATVLPAVLAWSKAYWAVGLASPASSAQNLARAATGAELPAAAAYAALLAATAGASWGLGRYKLRRGGTLEGAP